MDLLKIIRGPIASGLALLPAKMSGSKAKIMLLAIGLQESRFEHRRQMGGPARRFCWMALRITPRIPACNHAAGTQAVVHLATSTLQMTDT